RSKSNIKMDSGFRRNDGLGVLGLRVSSAELRRCGWSRLAPLLQGDTKLAGDPVGATQVATETT
ncbi:hypothetical protein CLOM621_09092, partial [Clostridium sp. M62/1]